ncbi:MAG: DUF2461 domain-containing protein [Cyclobacteriaceae bacterium]
MKKTFEFLKILDKNNNREWFQSNKDQYTEAHEEMIEFADRLLVEMNKHDVIQTDSGKKSLYRIYRDVRFGKDKTPYKTNWAGYLRRATAERRGGYYYQVGPKGSFVMGGFFGPNPQDLLHIRRQLEQDADPLRNVINSKEFKGFFGELLGAQLKTAPKGFDKEHTNIDLLRYKQFMVRHDFTQKEVFSKDFHITVANAFVQMRPLFDYMSDILTSDLNGESLV